MGRSQRQVPPSPTCTGPLLCSVAKGVLLVPLHLSEVELGARHPLVDVLDVVTGALKVSGGVVRAGDEDLRRGGGLSGRPPTSNNRKQGGATSTGQSRWSYLAFGAQVTGLVLVRDADELLVDGDQEVQSRLDLLLGVARLHPGAGDGDVLALRRHVVSR